MKGVLLAFYLGVTAIAGLSLTFSVKAQSESAQSESEAVVAETSACPAIENAQNYDVVVFGDEVPGVMMALKVQRELRSRRQSNRVAIVTEGDTNQGIGGHLVRGGLAYLDRNQVPPALKSQYGAFGRPSRLYQEFLGLGQGKLEEARADFEQALDLHQAQGNQFGADNAQRTIATLLD